MTTDDHCGDLSIDGDTADAKRVTNARGFIPGTYAFLDRLEAHLGGIPMPSWSNRYAEVAQSYQR